MDWAIEDRKDPKLVEQLIVEGALLTERRKPDGKPLALRLHDVSVVRSRWATLLGGNDVRLDVLVVQGNLLEGDESGFYVPKTLRFEGVGDHEQLPSDEQGFLAYYGWPKHFLDISVVVSRDRKGSPDLATLLTGSLESKEFTSASTQLLTLAVPAPASAVVAGAVAAAAFLGSLALRLVSQASGNSIGVYTGNRLAYPDEFGLGRNPREGTYANRGLSLWYHVLEASPAPPDG